MLNFLSFMRESVSNFHACNNIVKKLEEAGFTKLDENNYWAIDYNKKYYVKRNDTSIIAFTTPNKKTVKGLNVTASHLDSPSFKVKPNSLINDGKYLRLNTEVYGGPILNTWLDKPLTLAGRVILQKEGKIVSQLLYIDKDLLIIPNMPPHLLPKVSKGMEYNAQVDLLPLLGLNGSLDLKEIISKELNVDSSAIIDFDLILVNRQRARLGGYNDEFVFSPQLDDLAAAYTCLEGFLEANNKETFNFYIAFDNEEVGSRTRQGAGSGFFKDVLERVLEKLNYSIEEKNMLLANSFIISCDNAHATNPNHQELFDNQNRTYLGQGVVVKYNANQSYTTDSLSASYLAVLAQEAKINLQRYTNRSDIRGGSTLGAILTSQVAMHSADIGLAQLAMHSSLEVLATKDLFDMVKLIKCFYNHNIIINSDNELIY